MLVYREVGRPVILPTCLACVSAAAHAGRKKKQDAKMCSEGNIVC